jgi:hypothetical protein
MLAPDKSIGQSYAADMSYSPTPHVGFVRALAGRIFVNVTSYPLQHLPSVLPQPSISGVTIDNVLGTLILLCVVVPGVVLFWKRARIILLYLVAYAALLAVWTWNESRLLQPILPALLCLIVAGAFRVAQARRWLVAAPVLVAAAIGGTAMAEDASRVRAVERCDRAHASESTACFSIERIGFLAAMKFVHDSTPHDAVILTADDAMTGYYADRQVVFTATYSAPDPAAYVAGLRRRGVRYILMSPQRPPHSLRLTWWRERCADVSPLKEFPATTLVLYLPPAGTATPQPNACAALDRYAHSKSNTTLWAQDPAEDPSQH